jgi:hypothetical protein
MSYRIDYVHTEKTGIKDGWLFRSFTLFLILLAIINGIYYFSGNLSNLREKLMPWTQPHVKAAALDMREEIAEGQPIYEAVAAFCREIIGEDTQTPIQ